MWFHRIVLTLHRGGQPDLRFSSDIGFETKEDADAAVSQLTEDLAGERVADLRTALSALIARVRRTGGYASPEDQAVLWHAERVLGEAGKGPSLPQQRAEPAGCGQIAGQGAASSEGKPGGVR